MKTPEEIAQWVINNRYPRNENEKVSDAEMYHSLVESITNLCNMPVVNKRICQKVGQCAHTPGGMICPKEVICPL